MEEMFFNAYKAVMPLPQRRIFCTWHVDRAWRKNLSRIRSREKQCEIYKLIRTLMEETDERTFEVLLEKIYTSMLNDAEAREFANYFFNNYNSNVTSWAFCFRLHSGVNRNMHLERMHRTIKEFYCHGKKIKRLDKMIYILQKFVRDCLYDQLIIQHKGKISTKISDIRKKHLVSTTLDASKIIEYENGWTCPSFSSSEMYFIQRNTQQICDKRECYLKCVTCSHCIHSFNCTCIDNAVKWNMCKHIHLLCQSKLIKMCNTDGNIFPHYSEDTSKQETAIISELSKNKKLITDEDRMKEEKQKLVSDFQKLVDEATSEEILSYKKEILKRPLQLQAGNHQTYTCIMKIKK
jgi:hypothetical protein